jgi:hypothetical protein
MAIVKKLRIPSAPARRQGFARVARRLTPPLTATVAAAQQVVSSRLNATASLINHWHQKHEIPDNSGATRRAGWPSPNSYDRKTPLVAADLLNDRVIPFFDEHGVPLNRVLTDRGTEYCGAPERHEYELYLAVENIDHTRTKTKSPETNGIVERFHKTVLNEF